MEHKINHSWESSNNGQAPFIFVTRKPAANTEGMMLVVTVANHKDAYSMNSIVLQLDPAELEKFGMELIRIAAATRVDKYV